MKTARPISTSREYGLRAVPSGLREYSDFWSHSLFPGYDFRSGSQPTVGYYVSAVVGTLLIAAVVFVSWRVVALARRNHGPGADDAEPVQERTAV